MKNLAKHKVAVRTREYIVQAIFQLLFNNESVDSIIKQFEDEHSGKKVDFSFFLRKFRFLIILKQKTFERSEAERI